MSTFRLGQIEEAVLLTLGAEGERVKEVRFRLRRLLAADRGFGRRPRAKAEVESYAFYGDRPLGTGIDVLFTAYEAFALLAAIKLLEHGFPPLMVVRLLRQIRRQLEGAHGRCLQKDPKILFNEEVLNRPAPAGTIAFSATTPVILVVARLRDAADVDHVGIAAAAVCESNEEFGQFTRAHNFPGQIFSIFELTRLIHVLAEHLLRVRVRKRGRRPQQTDNSDSDA